MKQAIILAGGFGKRLEKIFPNIPKPMVQFFGKPLLQYQLELCRQYGFNDIKILLHHQASVIQQYFGNGSKLDLNLDYFIEDQPLGTAGAVLNIYDYLDDHFIVIYGDTYLNVDLDRFFKSHIDQDADATLFIHPNNHPHDSDLVEVDDENYIKAFHSYPHKEGFWYSNLVNAALYSFKKESLSIHKNGATRQDFSKDLFPQLLRENKKLFGYASCEYIKDMGTPERIQNVEKDISTKKHIRLQNKFKKNAIFLDRDGVINQEQGLVSRPEEFVLIEGASDAIRKINDSGILAIVITNQPIIARGDATKKELKIIHNKMETLLGLEGAYLDAIYYCPHHPDRGFEGEITELKIDCNCRKPNTGMITKATKEMNIDLNESWLIGDSTSDLMTAHNIGLKNILVQTGYAGKDKKFEVTPDHIFKDLNQATDFILNQS
ncbi:MAG: D,D-heptose 1,7-bisphosphate phosphatase [Candidatus Marinimicrobia bacterium]|nr:D,D-heptose 1,7-bisphosphate phosphatase [Candidatus Neomarinimicrobiota bacterium]|tara:strand:+ start:4567 stop:5871 length:1305 start_codon:yes stop_codon:yes gene_type:complete